ncbi:MAG: hypothetical protein ABIN91_20170 [Mucilaginibacter sp.]|uniref:hypothetical protein n=1 Tax=Mucilaginibacter sp. TaxID=1882438 RepID=UPI0032672061
MVNFLFAKHWQLFLLMIGISVIGDILTPLSVLTIISMGAFLAWLWAVAILLQSKVPQNVKMKTLKFKLFFFVPLIYVPWAFYSISNHSVHNDAKTGIDLFITPVVICLHLFTMFCVFYCMYFAAKTVRTIELQRKVVIDDFSTVFLMIWFFPIGIWILQPRINRNYAKFNALTSGKRWQSL